MMTLQQVIKCLLYNGKCSLYSNQLGKEQSRNTDSIRYATSGGISNVSVDTKKDDPLLYEDPLGDFGVEVTKPQVKGQAKKSATTATALIYESPD